MIRKPITIWDFILEMINALLNNWVQDFPRLRVLEGLIHYNPEPSALPRAMAYPPITLPCFKPISQSTR
jgi:hypothetical protein